jgi:hypothetical protein
MILDTATRSLAIVLGEAMATTACDITACFATVTPATFVTGLAGTVSAGTTPVVVVAAPAAGSQVQVNEVRLHNNDSVPHTVTLQLIDGGTVRVVLSRVIRPGGDFLYSPTADPVATPAAGLSLTLSWGSQVVSAGTFVFTGTAAYPFVIGSLDASVGYGGGTITANVRNAGSSVGGLGAAAITLAAKTNFPASGAHTIVPTGATVDVVLALTGTPVGAFLSLNGTKI